MYYFNKNPEFFHYFNRLDNCLDTDRVHYNASSFFLDKYLKYWTNIFCPTDKSTVNRINKISRTQDLRSFTSQKPGICDIEILKIRFGGSQCFLAGIYCVDNQIPGNFSYLNSCLLY